MWCASWFIFGSALTLASLLILGEKLVHYMGMHVCFIKCCIALTCFAAWNLNVILILLLNLHKWAPWKIQRIWLFVPGVLFTEGAEWKTQRRFTLHHFRNLGFGRRDHEAIIQDEAKEIVDLIRSFNNNPFEMVVSFSVYVIIKSFPIIFPNYKKYIWKISKILSCGT